MDRARSRIVAHLVTALLALESIAAGLGLPGRTLAASVGWPPSTLVVSELQTGGASASDEFVEIANQGAGPVDLGGLELVYATSSGSTVTRKATWSSPFVLDVGRRTLVANASGSFAALADATYSGGFAATGGALALRVVGGAVIDAVGWGDATNGFVEGVAAPAPPAGSSLERLPGGAAGNGVDTNTNASDWFVQAAPSPQGLGAPAVPAPGGPTPTPTPMPTPVITPDPTPTPTPVATPTPTPLITPAPTPTPTPLPTPTPGPIVSPIAAARGLADGAIVTIAGRLTTELGALESGRSAFIEDASGGIGLYLDATAVRTLPIGTGIRVTGSLDTRYAQRVLRLAEAAIELVDTAPLADPTDTTTGGADEALEGQRVRVTGTLVATPTTLADGLGLDLDDGSGVVKVIVGLEAQAGRTFARGPLITATGPLGQRDSSGSGAAGYRIYVRRADDLFVEAATPTPIPTPASTPTPTPTPTPMATPTPTPVLTPTPVPTPTPSPTPATTTDIAAARRASVGATVTVRGVVTAEAGRLGTGALIAIADATAGIVVRLPDGAAGPSRGTQLVVTGRLAAPYGQIELRPAAGGLIREGAAVLPAPLPIGSADVGEATEGRLVVIEGRLPAKPTKVSGGDTRFDLAVTGGGTVRVLGDQSSGLTATSFAAGGSYRLIGVVGQRATRSGALDGYRVWLRDAADVTLTAAPPPSPTPTPKATRTPKPTSPGASPVEGDRPVISIALAVTRQDADVAIEGIVIAPPTLIDASGRSIVVADATGAVEVRLATGMSAPPVAARIRVDGSMGVAYGAPRLHAERIVRIATAIVPPPLALHRGPAAAEEWRLVSVTGRIDSVHKLGDRWRAELVVGSAHVVVVGQAGARIPATAMVVGRDATIIGIARRPFPTATDRRFAILPRSLSDVRVSSRSTGSSTTGVTGSTNGVSGGGSSRSGTTPVAAASGSGAGLPRVDLLALPDLIGRTVRVGGLVTSLGPDGFTLDDGTSDATVRLVRDAMTLRDLVGPDDAVEVTAAVTSGPGGLVLTVDDPGALVLVADPGGASAPTASDAPGEVPASLIADGAGPVTGDADGAPDGARLASATGPLGLPPAGAVGIGSLALLSAASLAVTLLRRRQLERRLAARIAARLATLADASVEHDSRTGGAA